MSAKKGLIVWAGERGSPPSHRSRSVVGEVVSNPALLSLKNSIGPQSQCIARKTVWSVATAFPTAINPGSTVDRIAIIYFRHPVTLQRHCFSFPDPNLDLSGETPEGERIHKAVVSMIVGFISTATGINYTPLYGVVIKRR